jgi:hypothetical protein
MLRGSGLTSSVIHTAGASPAGLSAIPNVLVVLTNTKLPTPASADASSRVVVPEMFVSMKAWVGWLATCGLWRAAE